MKERDEKRALVLKSIKEDPLDDQVKQYLEQQGFEVDTSMILVDAIQQANNTNYDLMILPASLGYAAKSVNDKAPDGTVRTHIIAVHKNPATQGIESHLYKNGRFIHEGPIERAEAKLNIGKPPKSPYNC
ncbi:hypothetical protein ACFL6I_09305 [candidate division KSB1 bacterium]